MPDKPKRKNDELATSRLRRSLLVMSILIVGAIGIALLWWQGSRPKNDLPTARLSYVGWGSRHVYNLQTGEEAWVESAGQGDNPVLSSPDGNWSFQLANQGNYRDSYLIVSEWSTGTKKRLGPFWGARGSFTWSPDSQWIAFAAYASESEFNQSLYKQDLWMINVVTEEVKHLTSNDTIDYDPAFSPDGKEIAYICDAFTHRDLCVLTLQSGLSRVLGPASASLAWSPDDRWIAYMKENPDYHYWGDIWIVRVDGTEAQPITNQSYGAMGKLLWLP